MLWGDVPLVLRGHHHHLFWDQTIDDVLGPEVGQLVRTHAAREAFHDLLEQLVVRLSADEPSERLRLAEVVASELGLGQLSLSVARDGGVVVADELHHGRAFQEKYGDRVRRRWPLDAVVAGFAAAATELAYDLPRESMDAVERECVGAGDRRCAIRIQPGTLAPRKGPLLYAHLKGVLPATPPSATDEPTLIDRTEALRSYFGGLAGDERGLAPGPGALWARLPSAYFGRTAAEAQAHVHAVSPGSATLVDGLFEEAGRADVFLSWGALLTSPEWEAMAGGLPTRPEEVIEAGVAIARASGWGAWRVAEQIPQERLVIHAPANPEALHWLLREDRTRRGVCWGARGAVLGLALLADQLDWSRAPDPNLGRYEALFRGDLGWRVREARCIAEGYPFCELVAERSPR